MADEIVDILIIGGGATGAAVSWSLSQKNLSITCLEQGNWMNLQIILVQV